MKEYFPHDVYAHKDPKCSALMNDFGPGGYGLYWALIEIMHEQGGKIEKFPKLMDGLAFELRIEKEALTKQIEAMLHEYNLFEEDENYIWSNRVLRNLEAREEKKKAKSEAGRIGGLQSGITRSKSKQCLKQNEAKEAKERKGKEIKGNNTDTSDEVYTQAGHLSITNDEFTKLEKEFGTERADDLVRQVLNYRKNSKYKSLYLTAMTWGRKEVKKENEPIKKVLVTTDYSKL